jgi:hypothetical protein
MVNNCANPQCAKPLHYLREGRIFVFDMPDESAAADGKRARRLEHFWLCGACSQIMRVERAADGVRLVEKPALRLLKNIPDVPDVPAKTAIAS